MSTAAILNALRQVPRIRQISDDPEEEARRRALSLAESPPASGAGQPPRAQISRAPSPAYQAAPSAPQLPGVTVQPVETIPRVRRAPSPQVEAASPASAPQPKFRNPFEQSVAPVEVTPQMGFDASIPRRVPSSRFRPQAEPEPPPTAALSQTLRYRDPFAAPPPAAPPAASYAGDRGLPRVRVFRAPSAAATPPAPDAAAAEAPAPEPSNLLPEAAAVAPQAGFDAALRLAPYRAPSAGAVAASPAPDAGGEAQPSPATARKIRDLIEPQVERPQMPDHSKDKKRGFWGNVGHVLEHAGKAGLAGLAASGGNPLVAAGAAIAGGINPEFADRLQHNVVEMPHWRRENEQAQRDAAATLGRAAQYEQITGQDPFTGGPSLRTKQYERAVAAQEDLAKHRQEQLADRDEQLRQGRERLSQAERRALAAEKNARINQLLATARLPGRQFDAAAKAEFEQELGVRLPDEFNPQRHSLKANERGEYVIVSIDNQSGAATAAPVRDGQGNPVKAPPKATAAGGVAEANRAETARRRVQKLIEDARKHDTTSGLKSPKSQQRSRELWDLAKRERDIAVQQYPRHLRAGPDQGGYASIERLEPSSSPGQAGGARSSVPPSRKVDPVKMRQHEEIYQKLYPTLPPADRQRLEMEFEKDYGRKPKAPGQQGAALLDDGSGAYGGFYDGDAALVEASYSPDDPADVAPPQNDLHHRFPYRDKHGDVYRLSPSPEVMEGKRPPASRQIRMNPKGWQESGKGRDKLEGSNFLTSAIFPESQFESREGWLRGNLRRDFLVTHAGWTKKTWERWKRQNPKQAIPDFTLTARRVNPQTREVEISLPMSQLLKLREFAAPEVMEKERKRLKKERKRLKAERALDELDVRTEFFGKYGDGPTPTERGLRVRRNVIPDA